MMKYINTFLLIFISVIFLSCDGGLDPYRDKSHIQGTIYFESDWPPADSLFDLRVVCFKNYPPKNIVEELFAGNAIYSDSINTFVDSALFNIEISQTPVTYEYIVVAQQYEDSLMSWKAVGVFTLSGNQEEPTEIRVEKASTYNIDIKVDFENLPPQPF